MIFMTLFISVFIAILFFAILYKPVICKLSRYADLKIEEKLKEQEIIKNEKINYEKQVETNLKERLKMQLLDPSINELKIHNPPPPQRRKKIVYKTNKIS